MLFKEEGDTNTVFYVNFEDNKYYTRYFSDTPKIKVSPESNCERKEADSNEVKCTTKVALTEPTPIKITIGENSQPSKTIYFSTYSIQNQCIIEYNVVGQSSLVISFTNAFLYEKTINVVFYSMPPQCRSTTLLDNIVISLTAQKEMQFTASIGGIEKKATEDNEGQFKYSITYDESTKFKQGEYPLIINGITIKDEVLSFYDKKTPTDKLITITNTQDLQRISISFTSPFISDKDISEIILHTKNAADDNLIAKKDLSLDAAKTKLVLSFTLGSLLSITTENPLVLGYKDKCGNPFDFEGVTVKLAEVEITLHSVAPLLIHDAIEEGTELTLTYGENDDV